MLIVFADDFSGAAEIGGIAYSNGLKAEIQKEFKPSNSLDVLIIDMDSRGLTKKLAFERAKAVSENVQATYPKALFFKKVDSTFRGHISAELKAHLLAIPFDAVWLLPNNPKAGRVVKNGGYFMQNIPLNKTQLAQDPDFPRSSNMVQNLFEWTDASFPYSHLTVDQKAPKKPYLCTADITTTEDINNRLESTSPKSLVCGSGETFRAFVKHLDLAQKTISIKENTSEYTVLLNGSTVKNEMERGFLQSNNTPTFTLPVKEEGFDEWLSLLIQSLSTHKFIAIYPDAVTQQNSDWVLNQLAKTASFLFKSTHPESIHFLVTGGATASTILELCGSKQYQILKEVAPGVVTSIDAENEHLKITTKPGSYPWGTSLLNEIYDKE